MVTLSGCGVYATGLYSAKGVSEGTFMRSLAGRELTLP